MTGVGAVVPADVSAGQGRPAVRPYVLGRIPACGGAARSREPVFRSSSGR